LRERDQWIRRRLRAIAWKQWKRGRTRYTKLRRRGVGRDLAARTAGSPHGPWRLGEQEEPTVGDGNAMGVSDARCATIIALLDMAPTPAVRHAVMAPMTRRSTPREDRRTPVETLRHGGGR